MVGNKGAIRNARLMLITLIGRDTNPLGNILELKRDYDYNLAFGFFMKWFRAPTSIMSNNIVYSMNQDSDVMI